MSDQVHAYVDAVPVERRAAYTAVRDAINANLPEGFDEGVQYGMLTWFVPLERFADTYNGQPLALVSLANQKGHMAMYLMGIYADDDEATWFKDAWRATSKKLDMGKSCVRFKRLDDVPLDVVGQAIARTSVDDLIAAHERAHHGR